MRDELLDERALPHDHDAVKPLARAAFMAHPVWETVLPCHLGPPMPDHRPVAALQAASMAEFTRAMDLAS
jgi:hypothetical protein